MARFAVPLFSTKRRPPSSLLLKPIKLVKIFGVLALGPVTFSGFLRVAALLVYGGATWSNA